MRGIPLVCVCVLLGCGGRIAADPDPLPDAASIEDTGAAALDAGPTRDASRDALADGPTPTDATPPTPACPTARPLSGSTCPSRDQVCAYPNACGANDVVACRAGGWTLESPPCVKCPPTPPRDGAPCEGPLECDYDAECGVTKVRCGGPTSYWKTFVGTPCPDPCPHREPALGEPCLAPGTCEYVLACGAIDVVHCNGTGTVVDLDAAECPGCPATRPTAVTPCPPTPVTCKYPSGCGGTDFASCLGTGEAWTYWLDDCP